VEGSHDHFAVRSVFTGQRITSYNDADPTVYSVDQVVARQLRTRFNAAQASVHLGARPAQDILFYQKYGRSTFFFTPDGPLDYEASPVAAYDRFLAGQALAPTPSTPGAVDRSARYRNAVLGANRAEMQSLVQKARRIKGTRTRLERHLRSLARLFQEEGSSGAQLNPVLPNGRLASVEALRDRLTGNPNAAYDNGIYGQIVDAQVDVLAQTIVSGTALVGTLQWGWADSDIIVEEVSGEGHHNASHNTDEAGRASYDAIQRWYAGKVNRLLTALDVPDPQDPGGNTVLHNSLVLWMSETTTNHAVGPVPCLYAGSAGGRLQTGGITNVNGATNRHLLKTICHAFGVDQGASNHFGGDMIRELLR